MMRSLQARLGIGVVVSVVVLFPAQWWVVNDALRALTESYFVSRLEDDMEDLLAGLTFDDQGRGDLNAAHPDPIFYRPFSGHYYQVQIGDQVIHSRSLWDRTLVVPEIARGSKRIVHTVGPQRQDLIMLVGGFEKAGRNITIAVAEDYSPVAAQFGNFQWRYVAISLIALLVLIGLQMGLARVGLRPLEQMRRDVRRLERGDIERLDSEVPAEVAPLVEEINHLITVLGQRLERSRNALGNLAHALKMPLTVLDQLLESEELAQHPMLREQLHARSEEINGLIQRELKRARLAGSVLPGKRFYPDQELPPLLAMFRQIYREKGLDVKGRVPPGRYSAAEREDMVELFGNLLDNACKWASHKVLLTVEDRVDLAFTVEDDGPGVADEALAHLTERGSRLDETVDGHGLGLAIAKEIVAQYGGDIVFSRSPTLSGFRVRVHLPAPRRNG